MLETMTAYENYEYNMRLVEDLFRYIGESVFGKTIFMVRGHEVDFGRSWERISMVDAVRRECGLDFSACQSVEQANDMLVNLGIQQSQPTIGDALVAAFEERVAPGLITPTFVTGHPVEISPLAKPLENDPRYVERFEIFVAGMECGDNWSEQNDAVQLLEVWQAARRGRENPEAQPIDYDFLEALEHGMPPTTGIGPGIERMAMIFTGHENIDDVIFFPMMKPLVSETNRAIYGTAEPAGSAEDMALTMGELEELASSGLLSPETLDLTVHPHLLVWRRGPTGGWRATGTIEISGVFRTGRLQVTGYSNAGAGALPQNEEMSRFNSHAAEFITTLNRSWKEARFTIAGIEFKARDAPFTPGRSG
jgi:hypothetical protein